MKEQGELFDGFVRLRQCRKCKRTLHIDPSNNYQTREAGLCFACLRAFNASSHWTVESFLSPISPEEQKAVEEFEAAVNEFRELMDSEPMVEFRTKVKKTDATQHELFTHHRSDSETDQDSHSANEVGEPEGRRHS